MNEKPWRCVYCKPKAAKIVKFHLERAGFETFLPLIKEKKKRNGKTVFEEKELFPNYIFVKFELGDYRLIRYTRGVSKVVMGSEGEPAIVPNEVIESIKMRMENGYVKFEKRLEKGSKVLVEDGPFKGFEAIFIEEIKPKDRVLILLKTITGELKVEIDESAIKPVKN